MPSRPIVLICSHTVPRAAMPSIAARTASASESIVTTTVAPSAASAGVAQITAPSPARSCAFSGVRFQARTANPARAMLRAIALPIVPPAPQHCDGLGRHPVTPARSRTRASTAASHVAATRSAATRSSARIRSARSAVAVSPARRAVRPSSSYAPHSSASKA